MKEYIKAYIAGIIDGEGSILLSKDKKMKFRAPMVTVSSTTIELLEFLKLHYGGVICSHKTYKEHHKPNWSWRLVYDRALELLSDVEPYLIVSEKRFRANHILSKYKFVTPRNGKYTPEMFLAKKQFEYTFFHPSTP